MSATRVAVLCETTTSSRYWVPAIRELINRGFSVSYVVTRRGAPPDELRTPGCSFFSLECGNSRDYPTAIFRLRSILKGESIEILHASEPIQGAIGGLACRTGVAATSVYHRHHASNLKTDPLSRIAAFSASRTIAVSHAAAEHGRKHDIFKKDRIDVVPNGIPDLRAVRSEEIGELKKKCDIPPPARVVVCVGHLRPEKGHLFLIRAMRMVNEPTSRHVHLVIVGDGTERGALEAEARQCGGPVHFAGHQDDVAPWYAMADVVAVPSVLESFGLTAVEAMAASKPVVATWVGGLPEIVQDHSNGLLVPPADPRSLADALREGLTGENDYGAKGRQRYLSTFTTRHMVDGWTDVYKRISARSPGIEATRNR